MADSIRVSNLSKEYSEGNKVLNGLSFIIQKGALAGVVGANGSGKTTLFKVLSGLIRDYEGEYEIVGQIKNMTPKGIVSYLPEVRGLDTRAYVLNHLTELLMYKGIKRKIAEKSISDWLRRFEIEELKYRKISSLSKGNQQKLQIILSLASESEIIILDEPFSGLDITTVDSVMDVLLEENRQGRTVLFSSHDFFDKYYSCDYFLMLKSGKLIQNGKTEDIFGSKPKILELKNKTAREEDLIRIAGKNNVARNDDEYEIKVCNEEMARQIFDSLADKYSEKFNLRKQSLSELFREIYG
ncbi:MAG: ATP-binding cassette domain-containing protein [Parasporobacterium sp.]|nr:ATP-binding cassette domain-containing protein [Parasporobacterium sp.]